MSKVPGERLFELIANAKEIIRNNCNMLIDPMQNDSVEDCAIFQLGSSIVLYSTDFGPPVGEDPYTAGRISALNAISDIYATGGKPEYALVMLSIGKNISNSDAEKILAGVYATCANEKVMVVGGHSIESEETLIGLSILGIDAYNRIIRKQGSKIGDKIWITKPLGTGLVIRGYYHKILDKNDYNEMLDVVLKSNYITPNLIKSLDIHAMSDITGFGFIGHLTEMLGKNQGARINLNNIPFLQSIEKCLPPAMTNRYIINNYTYAASNKEVSVKIDSMKKLALFDPQTNGGLIIITSSDMILPSKQYFCVGEVIGSSEILMVE